MTFLTYKYSLNIIKINKEEKRMPESNELNFYDINLEYVINKLPPTAKNTINEFLTELKKACIMCIALRIEETKRLTLSFEPDAMSKIENLYQTEVEIAKEITETIDNKEEPLDKLLFSLENLLEKDYLSQSVHYQKMAISCNITNQSIKTKLDLFTKNKIKQLHKQASQELPNYIENNLSPTNRISTPDEVQQLKKQLNICEDKYLETLRTTWSQLEEDLEKQPSNLLEKYFKNLIITPNPETYNDLEKVFQTCLSLRKTLTAGKIRKK